MKKERTFSKISGTNMLSTEVSKMSSFGPALSKSLQTTRQGLAFSNSPLKASDRKITSIAEVTLKSHLESIREKPLDVGLIGQQQLVGKYSDMDEKYHNVKVINDLIYNEPMHIVSVFKDYLIMDDINEFLRRPYASVEQRLKLSRVCHYYD